jgi:ABC-type sugar transport system substrate-binding protein
VAACNALGAQPLVADYGFDASKTLEDVRNYAAAGVDGIWVQAPTNDIIQSMADVAEQNKVYLGWIWNYLPDHFPWNYGSGKYVIINKDLDGIFDHTVSARSVFQTMKNAGHENGKCFVISGREGQATSNIRDYAVQQEWQKNYPNVDLRGFLFGQWSIEPAITATNQILAKQGTPYGAIGANDAIAIGMLRALDAQGIKVPAAGSDAQLPALQLLQNDKASSVIIDAGFNLAYDGGVTAAMLYDIAKGAWNPTEDDRLQVQGMIGIAYDVNAAKTLLGDVATPSFRPYPWFPVSDYVTQVVNKPPGPWNWQAMSMAKSDELHIKFDRTGGGFFGSNVYTAKQIYGSTDKWNQLYKDQSPKTPADYWGTRANNG